MERSASQLSFGGGSGSQGQETETRRRFNTILEQLSNPEPAVVQDAANELKSFIDRCLIGGKEGGGVRANSFEFKPDGDWLEFLEHRVTSFLGGNKQQSSNPLKQKAALIVLDTLMDKEITLKSYPRHLGTIVYIKASNDIEFQEHAARTMGRLHVASGKLYSQSAEFGIKVFFEFLSHYEDETQMLQAVLMLKEIAIAMPTIFIAKAETDSFFNRLLAAFQSSLKIREKSAELLNVAVRLFAQREGKESIRTDISTWAHQIYRNSKILVDKPMNEGNCHASVLMLNELISVANERHEKVEDSIQDYYSEDLACLRKSSVNYLPHDKLEQIVSKSSTRELPRKAFSQLARKVVINNFTEICTQLVIIMRQSKSFKDPCVRDTIVPLLPRLAAVDPNLFEKHSVQYVGSISGALPDHLKKTILMDSVSYLMDSQPAMIAPAKTDKRSTSFIGNFTWPESEIKSLALLVQVLHNQVLQTDNLSQLIFAFIQRIFPGQSEDPSVTKKSKQNIYVPPSAYALVANYVKAMKYGLENNMMTQIEEGLLKQGLRRELAVCFHELCAAAPREKGKLRLGLRGKLLQLTFGKIVELDALKTAKTEEPATSPSSPSTLSLSMGFGTPRSRKGSSIQSPGSAVAEQMEDLEKNVILALDILGSFDFTGVALAGTINYCANKVLLYEKNIRLSAARACCNLLISDDATFLSETNRAKTAKHESEITLKTTLPKMINIGVTDRDKDIRLAIISSLDSRFDPYLAQSDNLTSLFIALYDEYFKVREYVVCILGRLSERNAAFVMPILRKFLVQLLSELEYSKSPESKKECTVLTGNLVYNTPRLVRPYLDSIMNCLIPKLSPECVSQEPEVAIAIMRTVGMQAEVTGQEIAKYLPKLMPIIMDFIKDSRNPEKRMIGLWTLGHLVFSSGYVIEPYTDYPELLEILLETVKSESCVAIRRETIKVLGAIGPLDPYTYKTKILQPDMFQSWRLSEKETTEPNLSGDMMSVMIESSVLDEVYPAVATDALLKILTDQSLSHHWPRVIEAFKFMVVSMGIKSVSFIWRIIPSYLQVLRTPGINSDQKICEIILSNLARIVVTIKDHMRPFLKDIIECMADVWNEEYQIKIIDLLKCLAIYVGSDLKLHYHLVLPHIMGVLKSDSSAQITAKVQLVSSLQCYGPVLDSFIHMLLPAIANCLHGSISSSSELKMAVLDSLIYFCEKLDVGDFASLIIHAVLRLVDSEMTSPSSFTETSGHPNQYNICKRAFDVISAVCFVLKSQFYIFQPVVDQTVKKYNIQHTNYDFILKNVNNMFTNDMKYRSDIAEKIFGHSEQNYSRMISTGPSNEMATPMEKQSLKGEIQALRRAWSTEGKVSKDDWLNWFKNFSYALLNLSPSQILRGCSQLDHPQLRKDLFNVAFLSVWVELDQMSQDDLNAELEAALNVENVPELTLAILNLAEFMEHSEKGPLPLNHLQLGERALKSGAYAKALYYRESALRNHQPNSKEFHEILESLIRVNTKLQNYEAANGALKLADKSKSSFQVDESESWYESLGHWEAALQQYNLRISQFPMKPKISHVIGKMRCLNGLSEWEELNTLCKASWNTLDSGTMSEDRAAQKEIVAQMAIKSCWALADWNQIPNYIDSLPQNNLKQTYYRAAMAIHDHDNPKALKLIQECRDLVDNDLTTLVLESYSRAYSTLVFVKHLNEMEEVIAYEQLHKRQDDIKLMWRKRLLGGQPNLEDWQNSLIVHSLTLTPEENEVTLLKFAGLCMRQNKMKLSFKIVQSLLPVPGLVSGNINDLNEISTARLAESCNTKMPVVYMYMKQLWEVNQDGDDQTKKKLIDSLNSITKKVYAIYANNNVGGFISENGNKKHEKLKHVARFCLLNARWQRNFSGVNLKGMSEIIASCQMATENDKMWYKAWRMLAQCCTEAVQVLRANMPSPTSSPQTNLPPPQFQPQTSQAPGQPVFLRSNSRNGGGTQNLQVAEPIRSHFLTAVTGYVKSIKLCWDRKKDTLQDTLRLLTLLFENACVVESAELVLENLKMIHIDVWLQVIPQLIARVGSPRTVIGKIILPLLVDIGKAHPHAAIYPLMVGAKSSNQSRKMAIISVQESIKEKYPEIIKQAEILSRELIRVSILWHELWHEALEEASRMYFSERNPRAMFAILQPVHEMIEAGPETMKETSFNQHFGRDLMEAKECCNRYQHHGNARELSQAWDLYYQVFRRITKQIQPMTSLELNYVSPKLLNCCRDMELAMPGTYEPNKPVIKIAFVNPTVSVLSSKQRPRKLCMTGSNGKEYQFLLKGHEDLRQDERVLQLFGLVNSLLENDKNNLKRNLGTIPQYSCIPLSTNSGLIGWVPHTDTLHTLIKDYREKIKTHLNLEHRLMLRLAADYDHLTKMQKVEVFESALNSTHGMDLAKIMWYRSANSEIWYERRLTYTRSLAVMSIVGYILGLGDRHPSNIMLERTTGNIIHIDFGDCFEVAMTREKFPEKIPFRLTRMLINAMEINGIEGNYRSTCEVMMSVLRQNKDSIVAVLEAFVNDPLLNWLVLENRNNQQISQPVHPGYTPGQNGNGQGTGAGAAGNGASSGRTGITLNRSGSTASGNGTEASLNGFVQPEGNRRALDVLQRVNDKLNGEDFGKNKKLDVPTQVAKLIDQATSHENLCQCYIGWCPFW